MQTIKRMSASILLLSVLGLSLPLLTHADPSVQESHHGMHDMHGRQDCDHEPRFLHGLNLTEAQRDKIFNILHAQAPAMRDQFKQVRKSHQALDALVSAPQFDENKARQLSGDQAKAMATLSLMRARTNHEIFQVLTPEQQQQVKQRQAQRTQEPRHPAS
jgi:Spy/CpxP family protein refolding chaperone